MAYYRIYALDGADHIRAAFDAECENDETALAHATTAYATERALEVWSGDRCVCRVAGAAMPERSAAD